jgi:hypothetical protein
MPFAASHDAALPSFTFTPLRHAVAYAMPFSPPLMPLHADMPHAASRYQFRLAAATLIFAAARYAIISITPFLLDFHAAPCGAAISILR